MSRTITSHSAVGIRLSQPWDTPSTLASTSTISSTVTSTVTLGSSFVPDVS